MGIETGTGFWFTYCPRCGNRLVPRRPDASALAPGRSCPNCGYHQYRNPVAVVAAILLSSGPELPPLDVEIPPSRATHILMVRRTGNRAGSWCIPCGYVEYEEDIREAAWREIHEETGLYVAVSRVWGVKSNFHDAHNHTVGTWFLTRYLAGELRPHDDADMAEFVSLDALPHPIAFPTDLDVILEIRNARVQPE